MRFIFEGLLRRRESPRQLVSVSREEALLFGAKLRAARIAAKLTQRELATLAELKAHQVSQFELARDCPSPAERLRLVKLFGEALS